jgi:eukaryotic-like serine/threonine-protein kinase
VRARRVLQRDALKVIVHIIAGPAAGRLLAFDGVSVAVVGRAPDVEISVTTDTALSRRHCQIELGATQVRVRDLDSKHGVFRNGERVRECALSNGDLLQAGETVLRFEVATASVEVPPTELPGTITPGPTTELESLPPPPGYELVRRLGAGAMGTVHLARHLETATLVAIKQILPRVALSPGLRRSFVREASVQHQLDHPAIVRVFDLVDHGGGFQLVMELIDGPSGDQLLAGGVLDPATVAEIGGQVLEGLMYAHARNIVHRDIKEANLLFPRGGPLRVKIADFGLAKNFQESGASGMTQDGAIGGTLPYMPREQLLDYRYVKPPADIYALGATMYRLATREFPRRYRDGDNPIRVALEEPIVPLRERDPSLPSDLCAVIERALETSLDRRYPSAAAMLQALQPLRSRHGR